MPHVQILLCLTLTFRVAYIRTPAVPVADAAWQTVRDVLCSTLPTGGTSRRDGGLVVLTVLAPSRVEAPVC